MRDLVDQMREGPGRSRDDQVRRSDLVDVALMVKAATPKAFLLFDVSTDAAKWVPKSLVEQNDDGTFTMPEWIAKDRGWI